MNDLKKYLTKDQKLLWESYLDFKAKGIKAKSKDILNKFVDSVKSDSKENIDLNALEIKKLSDNKEISIQFPLFKEIVLPTLIKFAKQNKPGFHRMIAEHEQFFFSDARLTDYLNNEFDIKEKFFDTVKFFEIELKINPNDSRTAELLVIKIAQGLDYAIHELPDWGLCWDFEYFSESIDKLADLMKKYGLDSAKWIRRLNLLTAIRKTWSDYLEQKEQSNYRDYLELINNDDSKVVLDWPNELIYDR